MKIKYILLYILALISCTNLAFAADTLGVGTPYLPEKIQMIDSKDLVTNLILNNISTYFAVTKNNPKDDFKPKKMSRTVTTNPTTGKDQEIWDLEYNDGPSISKNKKFDPETIKNSVVFFKDNFPLDSKLEQEQETINSIKKISSVDFSNSASGFNVRFRLSEEDPKFISALAKIPLIDEKTAEVFAENLGEGTNLPLNGRFLIKDFEKESQILLIRNSAFGYYPDKSEIDYISVKKYTSAESRMKAIRGGAISIIVIPSLTEINDALNDPTLEVINSPFRDSNYTIPKNIDFSENTFDLNHIIVRRSLNPDENFLKQFQLYGLSKDIL